MNFTPPHCPHPACPSQGRASFEFTREGSYLRICDGVVVPRFRCKRCRRGFSRQTFRVDYRLRRPQLDSYIARDFVSKVTMRQSARTLGCHRETVELRLRRYGQQGWAFHQRQLQAHAAGKGLTGAFQLDELETFERDRRLAPVTVPVLIHEESRLILHVETGKIPARGNLPPTHAERRRRKEKAEGRRRSTSARVVRESLLVLQRFVGPRHLCILRSDQKYSYASTLRKIGLPITHQTTSSRRTRSTSNPLFPINHTLAMLRDGVSRLVRRSWGASKLATRLKLHLWLYVAWRNYVRKRFNRDTIGRTPGVVAGVAAEASSMNDLLGWRVFTWRHGIVELQTEG